MLLMGRDRNAQASGFSIPNYMLQITGLSDKCIFFWLWGKRNNLYYNFQFYSTGRQVKNSNPSYHWIACELVKQDENITGKLDWYNCRFAAFSFCGQDNHIVFISKRKSSILGRISSIRVQKLCMSPTWGFSASQLALTSVKEIDHVVNIQIIFII